VNPITGNDTNDGLSSGTAVQTIMGGIVSRWGTSSPILKFTTTIHLLASETFQQEEVILSPILTEGANFVIRGEGNPAIKTDTIDAVVSVLDPNAGPPGTNLIFTISTTSAGLSVGNIVFNTTTSSYAIIDAILGDNITVTQPLTQAGLTTVSAAPSLVQNNAWAIGDNLVFYDGFYLNLKILHPQGGDFTSGFDSPVCWLENLYIPSDGAIGYSSFTPTPVGCSFVASNCQFDAFVVLQAELIYYAGQFQNCWLNGGFNLGTYAAIMGGAANAANVNYCGFFGGIADLNAILHGFTPVSSPGARFGQVQVLNDVQVLAGAVLQIFQPNTALPILWGTAYLRVAQANSSVANATLGGTRPWTTCLRLTNLYMNGITTGYAFDAGTGTYTPPGVGISSANLDFYQGLYNPRTGCSFSGPWFE